ncbi:small ribosomal subunit Rsm22 family protein [Kribbella shirazensis]|uniref:Ribosomal protein RSM22 (Predicted rRNA methylase) n=1 Tax=Kribbella shirazensis TaxID=1105143 RepID=A0A7X5VEA2_9ACTN|nr:small ribosomal subunit Rsm22 family protein [Kribbella shirazensis]NIK59562.1 ribosomal protein RSM22 (predicted rRNA methylase) [Kribbella shirazensis]
MSSVDTQLHAALARAVRGVPYDDLRRRVTALSERYRSEQVDDTAPGMTDALDALAYAVVRMPATFRALHAALATAERHVDASFATHLDIGGGTGAAAWAAASHWPAITTEVVERQPAAIRLGRQLAAGNFPRDWRWTTSDLRSWTVGGPVDLVTIGYVLNELTDEARRDLIRGVTRSATTIVLVEPGTPRDHRRILEARDLLIEHGFRIAAPCPHQGPCPVDWCHFAARLPRTELHRTLKDGTRNFEDEKFTYVVATRGPIRPAPARVIARPLHPKNRVVLDLCTSTGTAQRAVVPKSSESYRTARSTTWGDAWT